MQNQHANLATWHDAVTDRFVLPTLTSLASLLVAFVVGIGLLLGYLALSLKYVYTRAVTSKARKHSIIRETNNVNDL